MAINRTQITAQSIKENTSITVNLLQAPPDPNAYLTTPVEPNTLVGFYSDMTDTVQLYVTDSTGYRYIPVV